LSSLGIYIHWPWCKTICPYCDFNVRKFKNIDILEWEKAYIKEIYNMSFFAKEKKVSSIYFGGGTPSLIEPGLLEKIINCINKNFLLSPSAEITIEANPSSIEYIDLFNLKQAGVNRLSLGIQSLNDQHLKFLGRDHNSNQAKKILKYTEKIFNKANLDIIYGLPEQNIIKFKSELSNMLTYAASLGHLSIYQLTIEPKTPFYKDFISGRLTPPPEEILSEMYYIIQEETERNNLSQYEISNHALPGNESIHNLGYWRYNEYLGIGPGAHSRVVNNSSRMAIVQINSPKNWLNSIQNNGNGIAIKEVLEQNEAAMEVLITGLRLKEFLPSERFDQYSVLKLSEIVKISQIKELIDGGFIECKNSKIKTTNKGKSVLNSIIERFDQIINSEH